MEIKIKRLSKEAILPKYAHNDDAGMDLYSQETFTFKPGERHEFALGFALEFPKGYTALVWDRGSVSFKAGLHSIGGVFDAGYRGEYKIMLYNLSGNPYTVEKHDKIAQLLIQPVEHAKISEVDILSETQRGEGGFGASGKK